MRPARLFVAGVLLAAAVAAPAHADAVIEFNDGRYLRVTRFEILEDWVRVDIGQRSRMLFPLSRIDRVERAGAIVFERRLPIAGRLETARDRPTVAARQPLPQPRRARHPAVMLLASTRR